MEGFVPFEAVDHTADLAFVARGRSLQELFENAALAMMSFLIPPGTVRAADEARIEVEGGDLEELLVAWLQEILYREEVHHQLFAEFQITEMTDARLTAVVRGEKLDPARHELLTDIKAATYHDLRIEARSTPAGRLYETRIVLDI